MAASRRSRSPKTLRQEVGLVIDPGSPLTLQQQIRHRLVDAMNRGILRPGRRLPSSRRLSRQIGVARNTVTLAYDALLASGHLISRARSGIFVAPSVQRERVTTGRRGLRPVSTGAGALGEDRGDQERFRRPPNWHHHPYPFLDGCVDATLVPADEWRESLRLAFGRRNVLDWAGGRDEVDDPLLSEELRSAVLPVWGLEASAGELLCFGSQRQALHTALDVVVPRHATVAVDAGVTTDVRRHLQSLQAELVPWEGVPASNSGARLPPGSRVLLSGRPGVQTMLARAEAGRVLDYAAASDLLILECAATPEIPGARRACPSLRALDTQGRVVLVGALSRAVSLGEPPGLINAEVALIERLREARRARGAQLSGGLQRAWAHFIGLGHYAASLTRSGETLEKRCTALRDALNHYLHKFVSIRATPGASAYWVSGSPGLNAEALARSAAESGVLIEPLGEPTRPNVFAMGVTSLPLQRIREGVERLARIVRHDRTLGTRELSAETAPRLSGRALERAMSGVTLLYNTVYGDPCTIRVNPDGTLEGRAGYANEDLDSGRWWVEGERWFRQWRSWAYAEVASFSTVIDQDQVRWFNSEGLLVDTAIVVQPPQRRRRAAAPGQRERPPGHRRSKP